jgi:hypothetical protein
MSGPKIGKFGDNNFLHKRRYSKIIYDDTIYHNFMKVVLKGGGGKKTDWQEEGKDLLGRASNEILSCSPTSYC